jgi:caa(3)-type oxidase subunit IV
MEHAGSRPSHVTIWVWLVALLAAGMALFTLPITKVTATVAIFAIAVVKAFLVGRHYMHLRGQPPMLYAIVGVPVLLAVALAITLLPDIGFR